MNPGNSTQLFRIYFSTTAEQDFVDEYYSFPLLELTTLLQIGGKDEIIIEYSGPNIFRIFHPSNFFDEITILRSNDASMSDIQSWVNEENDASDFPLASKLAPVLGGNGRTRENSADKFKSHIKQILHCDFNQDNPTYPVVLKKADCFLSLFILNFVCPDLESFLTQLTNVMKLIKLEGSLILFGLSNAKYYTIDGKKYPLLSLEDKFIFEVLASKNFTVDYYKSIPSKVNKAVADFGTLWCVRAIKKTE